MIKNQLDKTPVDVSWESVAFMPTSGSGPLKKMSEHLFILIGMWFSFNDNTIKSHGILSAALTEIMKFGPFVNVQKESQWIVDINKNLYLLTLLQDGYLNVKAHNPTSSENVFFDMLELAHYLNIPLDIFKNHPLRKREIKYKLKNI